MSVYVTVALSPTLKPLQKGNRKSKINMYELKQMGLSFEREKQVVLNTVHDGLSNGQEEFAYVCSQKVKRRVQGNLKS